MGEYWKPVNVTRRELIDPHRLGCGLKLREWNYPSSPVLNLIDAKWASTDDVRAVSEEGRQQQLSGTPGGPSPNYRELTDDYVDISRPFGDLEYEYFGCIEVSESADDALTDDDDQPF